MYVYNGTYALHDRVMFLSWINGFTYCFVKPIKYKIRLSTLQTQK